MMCILANIFHFPWGGLAFSETLLSGISSFLHFSISVCPSSSWLLKVSQTRMLFLENWKRSQRTRYVFSSFLVFQFLSFGVHFMNFWRSNWLAMLRSGRSKLLTCILFLIWYWFPDLFWLQREKSNLGVSYLWGFPLYWLLCRTSWSWCSRQFRAVISSAQIFVLRVSVSWMIRYPMYYLELGLGNDYPYAVALLNSGFARNIIQLHWKLCWESIIICRLMSLLIGKKCCWVFFICSYEVV